MKTLVVRACALSCLFAAVSAWPVTPATLTTKANFTTRTH